MVIPVVKIKWFGHAAFLVNIEGKNFLIDPWILNPLSKVKSLDELPSIDYIIVTHDHMDHLGTILIN